MIVITGRRLSTAGFAAAFSWLVRLGARAQASGAVRTAGDSAVRPIRAGTFRDPKAKDNPVPKWHVFLPAAALALAAGMLWAQARPIGPAASRSPASAPWFQEGRTVWIDTPPGRLKTRVYESRGLKEHPVLVVLVHGDRADVHQGLYELARAIANGSRNVVAAAVLRPGYHDAQGETSSGKLGGAIGDNYTAEVVDDVDAAILGLKAKYHAGPVVLAGHSGGAAITADLIGRHPQDVSAALLLACACYPPKNVQDLPNPSLRPLDLVPSVSQSIHVRIVIGDADKLLQADQAYEQAIEARGVDTRLTIAPGVDHNGILRAPQIQAALAELLNLEEKAAQDGSSQ